jgi:hypothetical protein
MSKPITMRGIGRAALLLGALALTVAVAGCGSSGPQRGKFKEVTTGWSAKDSELVAKEMIPDMLSFPWIDQYKQSHPDDPQPTVIIQRITNKSHEHVPVDTFINSIKREILRSGQVQFVAGGAERERVREERKEQDVYASEKTRTELAAETGADFALSGTISSIVQQKGGTKAVQYQVDLKLINLKTTAEVWNGQKQITKTMEKSSFGF